MLSHQQTDLWTPLPGSWEEAVAPNMLLVEIRRESDTPPPDDTDDTIADRQTSSSEEQPM